MNLQELIEQTDLDMTLSQVKAFFLGVLCAEKPLPYPKALAELLAEAPDAEGTLKDPLKELWNELQGNLKANLEQMFPDVDDVKVFMEVSKDQLDYFLTALSLSGTNTESCDDEVLSELIDELEDSLEDMDDYVSNEKSSREEGEEFKEFLLGTWLDFTSTKQ